MGDHRTPPKPPYFDTVPEGTCRWCNKEVGLTPKGKPSKSRWHKACLVEYKMLFWPTTTRRAVNRRDKGICGKCGVQCSYPLEWHMDHIKPLYLANDNINFWKLDNLQTLCEPCHIAKTSQEATERAAKRKLLKEKDKDT
jgi:5-methylcytosine-specific restriction endonuclease McrA